ncbi:hypothetical protein K2173_008568 [Erythroxylum novogranatense]|uniref:CNNM transmembrane domain-containing protein n=1 Tax=Erythroxylum novogranatense TaxID=1862640 RepID=A0AAV8SKW1_9ROSI|nr:hypothetical protein K2173_008568 [Erythroxylum novogranatense]
MAANDVPCCEPMFWTYLVICVVLVSFAGLMSGLTLGLMSLSLVDLEKILPIVKNQHLLLCTLLIGNSLAMEALPIFLDALLPAWGAIIISVTLILTFGEIIPQAVCSRYGLSVGAKLSGIVRLIVIVLFPVAYPISKLLDWILGKKHSAILGRAELKTLVDLHGNEAGKGGELTREETTIITGALDMTQKTAKDAMTPMFNVFSLDINSKLDEKTMGLIISKGHSRVPIYSGSPSNIIGLILVKNLIKVRPEDEVPIRDLTIRRIPRFHERLPLYDILNQFQKGNSHMAVVVSVRMDISLCSGSVYSNGTETRIPISKNVDIEGNLNPKLQVSGFQGRSLPKDDLESPYVSDELIGIITLEDVIEELLQEEIFDETDEYVDVHKKIKINILPSQKSPLRSPRRASAFDAFCLSQQTPQASPLSSSSNQQSPIVSYHTSPILHSPFSRRTLSGSPGVFVESPTSVATSVTQHSPSYNQVSRKSYEKLRRPDGL